MNDITELAQRDKFEAWWERTQHNGNQPRFGWSHWRDGEGYKVDDDDSELDGMWSAWKAAGAELVEALEKAQKRISRLESRSVKLPKAMSIEGGAYCSAHAHYDSDAIITIAQMWKRCWPPLASRWRLSDGRNKNDMCQFHYASLVYSGRRIRLRTSRYRYLHLWRQPRFRPQQRGLVRNEPAR
ncbi:hypothetical protein [Klebsiella variicola]|uniref:hypothetical protein n=1 Tax=Klebsiella variicola TaxID=244366 RepID=UPI0025577313|nr:hypothetical protein [Klebsiella variicola]MEC6021583.1 hypothetical protein [Klebsiella variicola]